MSTPYFSISPGNTKSDFTVCEFIYLRVFNEFRVLSFCFEKFGIYHFALVLTLKFNLNIVHFVFLDKICIKSIFDNDLSWIESLDIYFKKRCEIKKF